MRCYSTAIRLAIVSLTAVVSVGMWAGCAHTPSNVTWISPISLSANKPGLKVSSQLIERLVVDTELSRSELNKLGLRGEEELSEEKVKKLLDLRPDSLPIRYVEYFDAVFSDASKRDKPEFWKELIVIDLFIKDAISLGDFDSQKADNLLQSLNKAAEEGDKQEQLRARTTAYRMLDEARQAAIRKARGYRQLVDEMARELRGRSFDANIGLVVDIRTRAEYPTISPLSIVTMRCIEETELAGLVFYERSRECDDFGVCRIEFNAEKNGTKYENLYSALVSNGREYLDKCTIIMQMLIDGEQVVRELPGKFTSHIAGQSR